MGAGSTRSTGPLPVQEAEVVANVLTAPNSERSALYKHALMLTVATVALTAGSAAYGDTLITTSKTAAQTTSTDGNITVGDTTASPVKDGFVSVTIANPAIEINSANYVYIATAASTISNTGTSAAIGVQLDATATGNGPAAGSGAGSTTNDALYSLGKIDLTGAGSGKFGILVAPTDTSTTPLFNGNIDLGAGSILQVTGDNSYGIYTKPGTQLNGNITILGSVLMNPTSTTATSGGNVAGVRIDGELNGNFLVDGSGAVTAYGAGANGVVITGIVTGSFVNNSSISAQGTASASTTLANPEASSAVLIANSIEGGFYNGGPLSSGSTTARAVITTYGTAPALNIVTGGAGATATPITIGQYGAAFTGSWANNFTGALAGQTNYGFALINRGIIQASPQNNNLSGEFGINIAGDSANAVTLNGGLFNSGTVSVSATTDNKATSESTNGAIIIGNYANVPYLVNDHSESNGGVISASISGAYSAQAVALSINTLGNLPQVINNGGTIIASVSTTDTTIANPVTGQPGLSAYAIQDLSGTLVNVQNLQGTIEATTTALDNNSQLNVALALGAAKSGVTVYNTGSIIGDVQLGAFNDTVTVSGTSSLPSVINGNISFGGGRDTLNIGSYASVTGALTEYGGGTVNVTVGDGLGSGSLTLTNTTQGLAVGKLYVQNGSTLGLAVSQAFNANGNSYVGPVIQALTTASGGVTTPGTITLDPTSKFTLSFGSFISTPSIGGTSKFILLDTPIGGLTISNFSAIQSSVVGTGASTGKVPYLFTGSVCTVNVAGSINDCGTTGTDSQLVLNLAPKTALQLGLTATSNAYKLFDFANAALATDNTLGAAFITDITNSAQAVNAYQAFVPDVSGSTRAVLISITDQASGPVGARQRDLRTYANKDGGTTLWGQEFFQRINSGNDIDAYRGSGYGFVLGADTGSPRAGRYGAAFTFFSGDQTNKEVDFSKTNNQWYMLTGYTDWRGKGVFLDSQLTVGYGVLDGHRYIDLTNPNTGAIYTRTAASKRAGLALAGGVTTGVVLAYGGTVITPQISFDGLTSREEGYTETGGGSGITGQDGFDLTVKPYYANSARGYFGTTMRQDIDFGSFYFQPELRAGYRYDFMAKAVKLHAAFAAVPASQFTLTGPDPERGNAVLGGSLAVSTGTWSFGLNYDYIRGTHGAVDQIGTLSILARI